jgi:ketosteroid isomerase-like protein
MTMDKAISEMLDRQGIRDLMARYYRGIDRKDAELIGDCFTEDAYARYGTFEAIGRDRIKEVLGTIVRCFGASTHLRGDQEVKLDGDTAEVETYAVDYLTYTIDGVPHQSTHGLRYRDTMVREGEVWRVKHRVLHSDWTRAYRIDPTVPLQFDSDASKTLLKGRQIVQ